MLCAVSADADALSVRLANIDSLCLEACGQKYDVQEAYKNRLCRLQSEQVCETIQRTLQVSWLKADA